MSAQLAPSRLKALRCAVCGRTQSLSYFRCFDKARGSYSRACSGCVEKGAKCEARVTKRRYKTCAACCRSKPVTHFDANGQSRDGYQHRCITCAREGGHASRPTTKKKPKLELVAVNASEAITRVNYAPDSEYLADYRRTVREILKRLRYQDRGLAWVEAELEQLETRTGGTYGG